VNNSNKKALGFFFTPFNLQNSHFFSIFYFIYKTKDTEMKNSNLSSLTMIAIGAAIIAALSPLSIPIGIVPVTLQTLAIGLVATVLKARETFLAVLLYLIMGCIGIPVFTGGSSGIGVLFGPTGGFLVAFLLVGTLISWALHKVNYRPLLSFTINILGHSLMLILGAIWLKVAAQLSWPVAFQTGFIAFLPVEILKAVLVTSFGLALVNALSHTNKYFTN